MIKTMFVMLTAFLVVGCTRPDGSNVTDSLPSVYSPLASVKSHVDSAEALVVKAKPESSKTGQALLDAASKEHSAANSEIDNVKTDLAKVASERDQLDKANASLVAENVKVKGGWGYRLQVFVLDAFWWLVGIVALHFALGIAGFFIAGPVGNILAKAGAIINPFTWFQTTRDNAWFNLKKPVPPCPECPPATNYTLVPPAAA